MLKTVDAVSLCVTSFPTPLMLFYSFLRFYSISLGFNIIWAKNNQMQCLIQILTFFLNMLWSSYFQRRRDLSSACHKRSSMRLKKYSLNKCPFTNIFFISLKKMPLFTITKNLKTIVSIHSYLKIRTITDFKH